MGNRIKEAIHGDQPDDGTPAMHPDFFCLKKSNSLIKNKRQKNKQTDKVAKKYNGGIIYAMRCITDTDTHQGK
jgi:hypothetical protein